MTKHELIRETQGIIESMGQKISIKEIETVTDGFLKAMVSGLEKDGEVSVKGYFTLKTKIVREREVPVSIGNPTEKKLKPATKKAVAKLGNEFQKAVVK